MSLPQVTDPCRVVMDTWHVGKPVAMLMGEFSAGKSTLLNLMLCQDAAPTKVTATPMPPTWFTYAEDSFTTGLKSDGTEEPVDLDNSETNFREEYVVIRRGLSADILKESDLIDAPGISDPELRKDALRFLSTHVDFFVWCTAANQAWRQTENAAFSKFAESTRRNSVLVITRFDKLRSKKDQGKVLRRVEMEAGPKFANVVALETVKAALVAPGDRVEDADSKWVKTGGYGFYSAFSEAVAATKPKARKAPQSKSKKAPAVKAKAAKKPQGSPAVSKVKAVDLDALETAFISDLQELSTLPQNSLYRSEIEHLIALISDDNGNSRRENESFYASMRIEKNGVEIKKLLSQVKRDYGAFNAGDTIQLNA